ncbi:CerR family C-terminal domain-containing protein [Polaromonas sp. A23]|uniref:CerR family C-terminal domain-containing protein n=1 Tax=Polaromonas sp. A23 TaxID=1944133 RepID=UPI000986848C|nr:CerR family C-terminal domain-containing protein [Polaromonas sp. A23]OOG48413.1 TetR family transcriptional regulator [Polaromonas sp. A23]
MKSASPTSPAAASTSPEVRRQRSDGAEARSHLLLTALRLFAERGFTKTSTREIALAAGVNIAAISYYFGDKAGLYRAVFTEPMGSAKDDIGLYDQPGFTLRQSLQGFVASFLNPMKQGEFIQQCTRLHFREMLEPTGVWAEELDQGIKPAHAALVAVLGRHLGVTRPDDDLHRLAFSITGLALQMYVTRDVIEGVRPQLLATPKAIDLWAARLVDFSEAMVAVELARRQSLTSAKKSKT